MKVCICNLVRYSLLISGRFDCVFLFIPLYTAQYIFIHSLKLTVTFTPKPKNREKDCLVFTEYLMEMEIYHLFYCKKLSYRFGRNTQRDYYYFNLYFHFR